MASFNKVILVGNLTARPEIRFSQSGNAWMSFAMAINDRYKSKEGEEVQKVNFVDVTAYGHQAETLSKYLDKGSPLLVEGRLTQDKWENTQGEKRSRLGVTLRRFQFIPGARKGEATAA